MQTSNKIAVGVDATGGKVATDGWTHITDIEAISFVKELEKRKIKVRHIVRRGKEIHPSRTTTVRYFPLAFKETTITTNIYAGKIALIIWTEPPEAIIIENKAAYESYKDYFELLWKNARK